MEKECESDDHVQADESKPLKPVGAARGQHRRHAEDGEHEAGRLEGKHVERERLAIAHAASTDAGKPSSVICVADPTATPMARSGLFLTANMTADACSAAFPTMGSKMVETNASGTFATAAAPWIDPTTTSDSAAVAAHSSASATVDWR
eukprot:CAMPEP_0202745892 /NCGR_PEP_ID=MMETSP1388-20130828/7711_1 /ASSEMBLY_ACC=CAM_ASM_000864 /TAXON_ID=37098 /ORGANISM="Isochrysis sp, Strain CCMP1244" /LENGTH=148 /DNA_ID=CAMNT_0049413107 /DNA_START=244 /DNA_END=687 /DNA_ORIENTATION=+